MKFKFLGALAFSLAMFGVLSVGGIGSGSSTAHAQTPDDAESTMFDNGFGDHGGETTHIQESFVIIINCGDFAPCFIFDGGFDSIPLDGAGVTADAGADMDTEGLEAETDAEGSLEVDGEVDDASTEGVTEDAGDSFADDDDNDRDWNSSRRR